MTAASASDERVKDSSNGISSDPLTSKRQASFVGSAICIFLFLLICCAALGCGVAVQGYLYLSQKVPSTDNIKDFALPRVTEILADNGELIGEFYLHRCYVVPVREVPQALLDGLVAAEGKDFWKRLGCADKKEILWAALRVLRAKEIPSGVRTVPLSLVSAMPFSILNGRDSVAPQNDFIRTAKAAVLCDRIEKTLVKEGGLLYLHVNRIYLGSGAYGVEAAARTYFGKSVKNLTIAECAMIAGLAKSPSVYSPKRNMKAALEQRDQVLQRMWEDGKITQAEYETARREEPVLVESNKRHKPHIADFVEQVRRRVVEKFGEETVYRGGLKVYTTFDATQSEEAQQAVDDRSRLGTSPHIKKIVDRRGNVLEENLPQH